MSLVYIVFARFGKLSFDRRERYVRPVAERMIAISEMLEKSIAEILSRTKREIRSNKSLSAHLRIGIFTISSAFIIVGSAIALFLSIMRKVFFNLLIGWKSLQLGSLSTMFEKFIGMAEQLIGILHIPTSFVRFLFYPFSLVYQVADLVNIDALYNLLTVTCQGAKSPIELFIDSAVLGVAILFIESNYNFMWAMTFQEMNKFAVVKYWIEGERIYSKKFILAVIALTLTSMNPFITILRFFLSFVNFGAFFVNNHVTHFLSPACVGIEGFQNQELALVNATSILVWWLILPMLYSTAEIVCPKGGFTSSRTTFFTSSSHRVSASVIPLPTLEGIDGYESSSLGSIVISDFNEDDSYIGSVVVSEFDKSNSGIRNVLVSEHNGSSDYGTIHSDAAPMLNRDIFGGETFSILNGSYDLNDLLNNRSEENDDTSDLGSVYDSIAPSFTAADDQVNELYTERPEPQSSASLHSSASNIDRDAEDNEIRDVSIPALPRPTNFALHGLCRYALSSASLAISLDLLIVYVTSAYVDRYQKLNYSQRLRLLRAHQRWVPNTIEQSVQLFRNMRRNNTSVWHKYENYFRKFELKARETDDRVHREWNIYINESGSDKLPPFYLLCYMAQGELCTSIQVVYTLRPVSIPLSYIIAFSGVGHLLTTVGRKYWDIVARKYQLFFGACFGIWFDETYEAYEIEDLLRNFTTSDPNEATVLFIPLIIASRVILLQALGDVTTLISIIVINICVAPLFVFSPKLRAKIPPLLYMNPREVAFDREMKELRGRNENDPANAEPVRVEEWVLLLRSLSIFLTESRLIVFLFNLVSLSLTIILLKDINISTNTLALLLFGMLPYYVGSTLIPIMYIGKRLNLTDQEFADVFGGWWIRIFRFVQHVIVLVWYFGVVACKPMQLWYGQTIQTPLGQVRDYTGSPRVHAISDTRCAAIDTVNIELAVEIE